MVLFLFSLIVANALAYCNLLIIIIQICFAIYVCHAIRVL